MTTFEPNPRLNVPIRLVANPTGDFAITSADAAPAVSASGAAICTFAAVEDAAGAIAAVSQLLNTDVPVGELVSTPLGAVKATSDLSFSMSDLAQAAAEGAIAAIIPHESTAGAGLKLAPPKFTY